MRSDQAELRAPTKKAKRAGRNIALFFYDGPASRAVAFENLLSDDVRFAHRLAAGFRDRPRPQLAHIATDGESYGHHHVHGNMAHAYAILTAPRGMARCGSTR